MDKMLGSAIHPPTSRFVLMENGVAWMADKR